MKNLINKVNQQNKKFFSVGFYNISATPEEAFEKGKLEVKKLAICQKLNTTTFTLYPFYKQI